MRRARARLSTNDVFAMYEKKGAKVTARKLNKNTVLLEGDRVSLEFLGDLLHACARSEEHEVQFSPTGAGMARFSKQSNLGFYVHRLPCTEDGLRGHSRKSARRSAGRSQKSS